MSNFLSINTNLTAILLQNSLTQSIAGYNKAAERLSTTYRINSAADDPAGLVMAENFKTKVNESEVAIRSAEYGVAYLETVEYAYSQIADTVSDIKDIAVQGISSTLLTSERTALGEELAAKQALLLDLLDDEYNNQKIFDDDNSKTIYLGTEMGTFNIGVSFDSRPAVSSGAWTTLLTGDVSTTAASGAIENIIKSKTESGLGLYDSLLLEEAKAGIEVNMLESRINMLEVKKTNYMAVESSIRDADVAAETVNATKYQLLQQATTTLLAQANQGPTLALNLISATTGF